MCTFKIYFKQLLKKNYNRECVCGGRNQEVSEALSLEMYPHLVGLREAVALRAGSQHI